MGPTVRDKVVCYIVRDSRLLVFRHLDQAWDESGLQVPAGSIEPGEAPAEAAVRESREETGLAGLSVVRGLGEADYDMAPARPEVHHRHFFLLRVDEPVPERWTSVESDASDGSGPIRFECYWMPLEQAHVLSGGQGALLGRV